MTDTTRRIDCGDTEHCEECTNKDVRADERTGFVKSLVMNALGRCDFYNGPNRVVFNTSTL